MKRGLPPGPRMPRALQAIGWSRRPYPWMKRCRERYGDSFTLRIMHSGTWVFLADPEDVKKVFTAPASSLAVALANPLLEPVLGRHSVMLLEEPRHMRRRKLMLPPFHGQRMGADAEMMAAVTRQMVREWPTDEPFALWPRMQAITQAVIMRSVFGPEENGRTRQIGALLGRLTEALNDPGGLSMMAALGPGWIARSKRFRGAMAPVEAALLEEADRRRREGEDGRKDIVSLLIDARYEDGAPLSERDLRDELMTLLTDGPTSSSLAWVFERLLRHPEKLGRLRDEVRDGEGEEYMDAVVKETLRLCPPVPVVVRRLLEPMELGGHELPAGTTVAPCVYLIHRDPAIYPHPRRFLPERFLEQPPGTYTWIPFGGGVRRCLAASYAELEMKRVLRTVLTEVDLEPAEGDSEHARRSAISFSPDKRGLVIARPRQSESAERWQETPIYS
ncbi:MAG TPA: cytochrome P450 [Solirubrobacterales bacterium]|nr:cytochrome P450 [Solirubrobacterales bacterium]